MKKQYNALLPALSLVVIAGCAAHSVNDRPQISVPPAPAFSVSRDMSALNAPWWESFDRPALNSFIDEAFSRNFDVAQAVAVLEQARAVARQTQTGRLPQIGVAGDTSRQWEGSDAQRGTASLGATLSWELDVWNRIGNAAKADAQEAQARAADVEAVKLSLSAEIANAYFGAVAAHEQIALLQEQLKLGRDLESLLTLRLDSGVGTEVDVLQQQARVADSETLIPVAQSHLAVFENRLDVLLGQAPDGQKRIVEGDTLRFSEDMPAIGVPAALLLNRPDLRAARSALVAADADIGAAIADRLPRVMLGGSSALQDAASYTGPVSLIMGSFVQPLLDWGQRKAEVERNKALYRERLAAYTQLYLEAVEDVENALIQEQKQRDFLTKLNAQRDILQRAVNAAEQRYKQGVDDYQPVIAVLQELHDVERDLVSGKLALISIRIDLFRAIGGSIDTTSQEGFTL